MEGGDVVPASTLAYGPRSNTRNSVLSLHSSVLEGHSVASGKATELIPWAVLTSWMLTMPKVEQG